MHTNIVSMKRRAHLPLPVAVLDPFQLIPHRLLLQLEGLFYLFGLLV